MLKSREEIADHLVKWLKEKRIQNPSLGPVRPVKGGWEITTYGPAKICMAAFFVGQDGKVADKDGRLR